MGRLVDPVTAAQAAGASALHPHWAYVTPDLVETVHGAGWPSARGAPTTRPSIEMLDQMGVDSIATDYPDLFDQVRRS